MSWSSGQRSRLVERTIEVLVVGLLVGIPLLIGGVLPVVVLGAGTVGLVLLVLLMRRSPGLPTLALICCVLSAYTLLQTLPLPMPWLHAVAPANAEVWSWAFAPFDEPPPGRAPLSLAPGQSAMEAVKWCLYAAVFWGASHVARRRGVAWCLQWVSASGGMVAAVVLAHGLAGARRIYGIYEPSVVPLPWSVGPFINSNNLAGYLNFTALCGLGLVANRTKDAPVWVGIAATACLSLSLATGSRAAAVSLLVGVAVIVGHGLIRSSGRRPKSLAILLAPVWIAVGVAAMMLSRAPRTEQLSPDLDKWSLIPWTVALCREHWAFGVGRGAFGSVFPAFRLASRDLVFDHAENFVLDWCAEWGLIVTALALAAFAWQFRWMLRRPRSHVVAVLAAMTALLLQNLADLGLEVPGICVLAAFATGSVSAARPTLKRARWFHWSVLGVFGAALGLAIWSGPRTLSWQRQLVHAGYDDAGRTGDWSAFSQLLRDSIARFPGEAYFFRMGALSALRSGETRAMPWLQRALARDPHNGRNHLVTADVLRSIGRTNQALLELKLAAEGHDDLVSSVVGRALKWSSDPVQLLRVVPEGKGGAAVLHRLAGGVRPLQREGLLIAAIERDPNFAPARHALASYLLTSIRARDGACVDRRNRCLALAGEQANFLRRTPETAVFGYQFTAEIALESGRLVEAEQAVQACEPLPDSAPCLTVGVDVALAARDIALARERGKRALNRCAGPSKCGAAAHSVGNRFRAHGDEDSASIFYVRAAEYSDTVDAWLLAANSTAKAGRRARAATILGKLKRRYPSNPRVQAELASLRAAAAQELGTIP